MVGPATPEYLKWSDVPITFDRLLIDGGSSLNILFLKTFDQMGLPRTALQPSRAPFHRIVPDAATTPIGQITLP
jgi:hypothetical protein